MFGRFRALLAEKKRRAQLCRGLGVDSVAIDCGANVGKITGWLANTGATVYAFEPNPYAFAELTRRLGGNPKVHCIPKAVSTKAGILKLYLHRRATEDQVLWSSGSSLLSTKGNINPASSVEVEVVDIGSFIRSLGSTVDVVKMDVEGVECEILNHLLDNGVDKVVKQFFVETHERIPELAEAVIALRQRLVVEGIRNINLGWI